MNAKSPFIQRLSPLETAVMKCLVTLSEPMMTAEVVQHSIYNHFAIEVTRDSVKNALMRLVKNDYLSRDIKHTHPQLYFATKLGKTTYFEVKKFYASL